MKAYRTIVIGLLLAVCTFAATQRAEACGCSTSGCTYCSPPLVTNNGAFGEQGMSATADLYPVAAFCGQNEGIVASSSQTCPPTGFCQARLIVFDVRNNAAVYTSGFCTNDNCNWNTGSLPIPGKFARAFVKLGHSTGITTSTGLELTVNMRGDQCCSGTPGQSKCADGNTCTANPCNFNNGCEPPICQRGEECTGGECHACEVDGTTGECRCH